MRLLQKIKDCLWPPKYTQDEWVDNEKERCYEIKCYKNGTYTHTVKILYFTEKQIDRLRNAGLME